MSTPEFEIGTDPSEVLRQVNKARAVLKGGGSVRLLVGAEYPTGMVSALRAHFAEFPRKVKISTKHHE